MTHARSSSIPPSDGGKTLIEYLSSRFTYQTAEEWAAHIGEGRLTIDGRPCVAGEPLVAGMRVDFMPIPYDEPPVRDDWSVLFEDNEYLFIDKPAFLPCHPGGIYLKNTLWSFLSDRYGTVHFVNRLDRETSGIVVVARNAEAASYANALMADRNIAKEYEVLVEGSFPETLVAIGYLKRDESSHIRKKMKFTLAKTPETAEAPENPGAPGAPNGPGYCETRFTVICRRQDGTSLIRAKPLTGRTHQIRATLRSLGFPVVGDKLYGPDETIFLRFIDDAVTDADRRLLRLDRQALHCSRIAFAGRRGERYDVLAPSPFGETPLAET